MQIDLATLPDDPALLRQMLHDVIAAAEQRHTVLQGAVQEREAENDKLRLLIQRLLRQQFGRRSEQLSPDRLQLGLEDLEQTIGEGEAAQDGDADAAAQSEAERQRRRMARPRRNLGTLPAHLPRDEVVIDVEHGACRCCGGAMHAIGELRTEQLDIVPAQLRVRVTRRPRYACRTCEGAVVVAPAPERPIDGGMATEALIVHVLVQLAFCWAHMRRRFYEFHAAAQSPLAAEVLARIRALYAIEAEIRRHPVEHRRRVRDERSRPIVDALHAWLQEHQGRVSAASDLAEAIRYALRHWPGLVVFLGDGRVEMDTNPVERAIRPHTLTRKNALFAGSDGGARHWAMAMTLIQTAELNGVEPMAYLTDVLQRIVSGQTKAHELHSLLPWNWQQERAAHPAPEAIAA